MNSQDITRALIDTTVARAMVEMDADPKRSVRKLCDLGRQFSRGRFQNQIFAIMQKRDSKKIEKSKKLSLFL